MLKENEQYLHPRTNFIERDILGKIPAIGHALDQPLAGEAGERFTHRRRAGRKSSGDVLDVKLLEREKTIIKTHLSKRRI